VDDTIIATAPMLDWMLFRRNRSLVWLTTYCARRHWRLVQLHTTEDDMDQTDSLAGICATVLRAFDRCDRTRGWWSCLDSHDGRCPAHWNDEKPCECGADELRAAMARLTAALATDAPRTG